MIWLTRVSTSWRNPASIGPPVGGDGTGYLVTQPLRACFGEACFSFFAARFSLTERPGFFVSPVGLDLVAIGSVYEDHPRAASRGACCLDTPRDPQGGLSEIASFWWVLGAHPPWAGGG